jgi:hypothetical protein
LRAKLGCRTDASKFGRAICEVPYKQKPACIPAVERAAACLEKQPETSWSCDKRGRLAFDDAACKSEFETLTVCLKN